MKGWSRGWKQLRRNAAYRAWIFGEFSYTRLYNVSYKQSTDRPV